MYLSLEIHIRVKKLNNGAINKVTNDFFKMEGRNDNSLGYALYVFHKGRLLHH